MAGPHFRPCNNLLLGHLACRVAACREGEQPRAHMMKGRHTSLGQAANTHLRPLLAWSQLRNGELQPTHLHASGTQIPVQLPWVSPWDNRNPNDTVVIKLKARPVAALHLHASSKGLKQVEQQAVVQAWLTWLAKPGEQTEQARPCSLSDKRRKQEGA